MNYYLDLNVDSGTIFLIVLITLLSYKYFNVNIIKYLIVLYFFYYINPEFVNKIIQILKNYFTDITAKYSSDILNQIKPYKKKKQNIIKNTGGNKTLAIDNVDTPYNFSRNIDSTPSGNRNLEAISTDNRQFDGTTYEYIDKPPQQEPLANGSTIFNNIYN